METATLSEARVYVGTYGKYNNGSLFGAWLDLSDYADKEEFYEACRERNLCFRITRISRRI